MLMTSCQILYQKRRIALPKKIDPSKWEVFGENNYAVLFYTQIQIDVQNFWSFWPTVQFLWPFENPKFLTVAESAVAAAVVGKVFGSIFCYFGV